MKDERKMSNSKGEKDSFPKIFLDIYNFYKFFSDEKYFWI
jgi:hypothetical protein